MLLLLIALSPITAQQEADTVFRFDDMMQHVDLKSVDMTLVPVNFYGEDIALKYYVLKNTYTFVIKGTPSSPGDKTEIEKPVIYNSLKKLSRYYKKMVKKGTISKEEARAKLHHALDVGLSVRNQDTSKFEDTIRNTKDIAKIASLFDAVILE